MLSITSVFEQNRWNSNSGRESNFWYTDLCIFQGFSLYEMSQDWKETITVCCTHCAPQIIYFLGKKNNLVVQAET